MEDYHDTRPMDCSPDYPADAEPTLGDMTNNQASKEVAGEPVARNAQSRAPRKRGSSIWKHFEKLPGYEEHRKVRCRHCDKVYVCNGCSTGNLWKHLKSAHPDAIGDEQPGPGSQVVLATN
jgi:BED zinc finger